MKTIILNRMYAGSYLDEGENIGHEVINLFKDDKGSNYIYINKDGKVNKNYDVEAVLLVKHVEKGVLEVIAKAETLKLVYDKKDDYKQAIIHQNEYIKEKQIRYGGVLLSDIYENGDNELVMTFKTGKLRKVKKPVFLIEDETKKYKYGNQYYFLPKKHFSTQSLKMYYPENGELKQDYEKLKELLNDSEIWEGKNTTKKIDLDEIHASYLHEGFLSIIKKENDELVISNLFSHIFNQERDVFKDFAKDVLKIKNFKKNYTILREKDNIDLLIKNDDAVIIIENKIKSKINGEESESSDGKRESQLSKYVKIAHDNYCDGLNEEDCCKKLNFYIFAPDYNQIDLEKYKFGDKYTIINYSKIYKFYYENAGRMLDIEYFKEFLNALKIHTMSTDNINFEKMKKQFIKNIKDNKKISNMLESKKKAD